MVLTKETKRVQNRLMPKKTAKKSKHQSFKLTPHNHPKERVILYLVVAVLVGAALGWILRDDFVRMIYGSAAPMMGY